MTDTELEPGTVAYRRALILADIEWQRERLTWAVTARDRAAQRVRDIEAHLARREAELEALPPP